MCKYIVILAVQVIIFCLSRTIADRIEARVKSGRSSFALATVVRGAAFASFFATVLLMVLLIVSIFYPDTAIAPFIFYLIYA